MSAFQGNVFVAFGKVVGIVSAAFADFAADDEYPGGILIDIEGLLFAVLQFAQFAAAYAVDGRIAQNRVLDKDKVFAKGAGESLSSLDR